MDNLIDIIHKTIGKPGKRPRTYRKVPRKPRKRSAKPLGKQLRYVKRNLDAVNRLLAKAGDAHGLNRKHQETLNTIRKLTEQQHHMYTNRTHKISDRIVSISQPHVRPMSGVKPPPM